MNKNILIGVGIGITAGIAVMMASNANKLNADRIYAESTVVINVNYDTNTVSTKDFNGNIWEFSECEDWLAGDICAMVMDNMGTDTIYDDQIISCKYAGWID